MRKFPTVAGGIRYLTEHIAILPEKAAVLPAEVARTVAPILRNNVVAMYGQNPPLADLAASTQAERERLDFTPNDPLVRSGDLRSKEEWATLGAVAVAGNGDPRSKWLEHGRENMPPRPVHLYGLEATEPLAKVESVRASRRLLE